MFLWQVRSSLSHLRHLFIYFVGLVAFRPLTQKLLWARLLFCCSINNKLETLKHNQICNECRPLLQGNNRTVKERRKSKGVCENPRLCGPKKNDSFSNYSS